MGWGREANGGGYLGWGREGRWLVLILLMQNSDLEGDRSREDLDPVEKFIFIEYCKKWKIGLGTLSG